MNSDFPLSFVFFFLLRNEGTSDRSRLTVCPSVCFISRNYWPGFDNILYREIYIGIWWANLLLICSCPKTLQLNPNFHIFKLTLIIKKNESRLMLSACCLCNPLFINFWMPESLFMKLRYVYHGTWANLNGVFLEFPLSVCIYMCLSLLGNGLVKCIHPFIARQQLGKDVPAATKKCCSRCVVCGSCRIKGK
jgi:hypothetical protein